MVSFRSHIHPYKLDFRYPWVIYQQSVGKEWKQTKSSATLSHFASTGNTLFQTFTKTCNTTKLGIMCCLVFVVNMKQCYSSATWLSAADCLSGIWRRKHVQFMSLNRSCNDTSRTVFCALYQFYKPLFLFSLINWFILVIITRLFFCHFVFSCTISSIYFDNDALEMRIEVSLIYC